MIGRRHAKILVIISILSGTMIFYQNCGQSPKNTQSNLAAEDLSCTNGAINFPKCDQCTSELALENGFCVQHGCSNNAMDFPNCSQCTEGYVLTGNNCVLGVCSNRALNYPNCNQCEVGHTIISGICSVSESDVDNDEIVDRVDNCPNNANKNQNDIDKDGLGDICDGDFHTQLAGIVKILEGN